jgi:hypothetical protein
MFFKRFWQIFLARNPERAVAFHSGQMRFRAGWMQKTGPL